jgi:hypothetical protein
MEAIMFVQDFTKATPFKSFLPAFGVMVLLAGCASHEERNVPTWGGGSTQPPVAEAPTTYIPPEQVAVNQASTQFSGRRSFTQGCSGNFSVRDGRTNREISSGRAYNSGNGFIVLDSAGRQVRALSTGTNTSVLFLPDCNCRPGSQSGAVAPNQAFAARAPSAATCSAT